MLKKTISRYLYDIIALLSKITPKKKGLILFWSIHSGKYNGNLKALYRYAKDQQLDFNMIWLTNEFAGKGGYAEDHVPLVVSKGVRRFWLLLRAQVIIIDAGYHQLYGNFNIVQLWHGIGFKNVGLLNPASNTKENIRHYQTYQFILASSEDDRKKQAISFGNDRVFITGSPRNDVLFVDKKEQMQVKKRLGLSAYGKVYVYMPTFRDTGVPNPYSSVFWNQLNEWLKTSNDVFVIKKHPWDKAFTVPVGLDHILDFTEQISDVQDLLLVTDVLISDYSSVVSDFVLLDRPVIYYMYDYEFYMASCRDIYYDLKQIFPGPFCENEQQVFQHIKNIEWFNQPTYKKRYARFKRQFNTYQDGRSSERVFDKIRELGI